MARAEGHRDAADEASELELTPLTGSGADAGPPSPVGERRRALAGGMWNAASTVLPMASAFLLSVTINRTLGIDAQGKQAFIAYAASLAVSLVVMSIFGAAVQVLSAARGRSEAAAWTARAATATQLTSGLLAAAAILAIGLGRGDERLAWVIAALTVGLDSAGWAVSARLVSLEGWSRVSARRLASQAAAPLLGITFLLLGSGIAGIFAAQAVAALGLLLVLARVRPDLRGLAPGPARPPLRPLLSTLGMFFLGSVLTQVVERRLELLFLDAYSPVAQIAYYSIAFNLVSIAYYVCTSATGAAVPSIAAVAGSGRQERVEEAVTRASRVVLVIASTMACAIATVGPVFILTAFADAGPAAALVPWLCITLLLSPLGHLVGAYWTGLGRLRPVLSTGAAGAVVDIVLAVLLIPSHGALGAVAANVGGQCTAAALILVHTRRALPGLQVPWRLLGRLVVVLVPASIAGVAAASLGGPLGVLVGAAAFLVVLAVLTRFVAPLDRADVSWLAAALPSRLQAPLRLLAGGRRAGADDRR